MEEFLHPPITLSTLVYTGTSYLGVDRKQCQRPVQRRLLEFRVSLVFYSPRSRFSTTGGTCARKTSSWLLEKYRCDLQLDAPNGRKHTPALQPTMHKLDLLPGPRWPGHYGQGAKSPVKFRGLPGCDSNPTLLKSTTIHNAETEETTTAVPLNLL